MSTTDSAPISVEIHHGQHIRCTQAGLDALRSVAPPADVVSAWATALNPVNGMPVYVDKCPCDDIDTPEQNSQRSAV
jgi:hypothetical protein